MAKKDVDAKLFKLNQLNSIEKDSVDNIIIMSGTYASQMPLVKVLQVNWNKLKDKNVIVIAVGAATADDQQSKISYERIPVEIRQNITFFKLPGQIMNPVKGCVKSDNLQPIVNLIKEKYGYQPSN